MPTPTPPPDHTISFMKVFFIMIVSALICLAMMKMAFQDMNTCPPQRPNCIKASEAPGLHDMARIFFFFVGCIAGASTFLAVREIYRKLRWIWYGDE